MKVLRKISNWKKSFWLYRKEWRFYWRKMTTMKTHMARRRMSNPLFLYLKKCQELQVLRAQSQGLRILAPVVSLWVKKKNWSCSNHLCSGTIRRCKDSSIVSTNIQTRVCKSKTARSWSITRTSLNSHSTKQTETSRLLKTTMSSESSSSSETRSTMSLLWTNTMILSTKRPFCARTKEILKLVLMRSPTSNKRCKLQNQNSSRWKRPSKFSFPTMFSKSNKKAITLMMLSYRKKRKFTRPRLKWRRPKIWSQSTFKTNSVLIKKSRSSRRRKISSLARWKRWGLLATSKVISILTKLERSC